MKNYDDKDITITRTFVCGSSMLAQSVYKEFIDQLVKHKDWLKQCGKWNLWAILSYIDTSKKWPFKHEWKDIVCITANYDISPGESAYLSNSEVHCESMGFKVTRKDGEPDLYLSVQVFLKKK